MLKKGSQSISHVSFFEQDEILRCFFKTDSHYSCFSDPLAKHSIVWVLPRKKPCPHISSLTLALSRAVYLRTLGLELGSTPLGAMIGRQVPHHEDICRQEVGFYIRCEIWLAASAILIRKGVMWQYFFCRVIRRAALFWRIWSLLIR